MKEKKDRIPVWLYPSTLGQIDNLLLVDNSKSRSELIENAILFYCGYITTIDKNQFTPEILQTVFTGIIDSSEDRISKLLFKMIVELSILMHVTASAYNVDEKHLEKLRGIAIEEVKRSNGNISLKDTMKKYD